MEEISIKDTTTGLYLTSYGIVDMSGHQFGNFQEALVFPQDLGTNVITDLNTRTTEGRFVGTNPPRPR